MNTPGVQKVLPRLQSRIFLKQNSKYALKASSKNAVIQFNTKKAKK